MPPIPLPPDVRERIRKRRSSAIAQQVESTAQVAQQIPAGAPQALERAYAQIEAQPFSERDRQRLLKHLGAGRREIRAVGRVPFRVAAMAEREGLGEVAAETERAGERQIETAKPQPSGFYETVVKPSGVFDLLDTGGKLIRGFTTPGVEAYSKKVSPQEWWGRIKDAAERGDRTSQAWRALVIGDLGRDPDDDSIGEWAKQAAAAWFHPAKRIGTALGAGVAGLGAAADIVTGRPLSLERAKQTVRETQEDVGQFVGTMLADPVSYLSFGATGGAKGAATSLGRVLRRAGVADDVAKQTAEAMGRVVSTGATTEEKVRLAERAVERVGAAQGLTLNPKQVVEDAWGAGGRFMESGQARIGAPLAADVAGVDLARLGLREHGGKRLLEAGHQQAVALLDKVGLGRAVSQKLRQQVFDPVAKSVKGLTRKARARSILLSTRMGEELKEIAKMAPADAARREEIIKYHIDPDYILGEVGERGIKGVAASQAGIVEAAGGELAVSLLPAGARTFQMKGRQMVAIPRGRYIPDVDLSQQERQWVAALENFLETRQADLVRAGVLEEGQAARNYLSGRYYPRVFLSRFGEVEPTVDFTGRAIAASRTEGGGFPLGRLDRLTPDEAQQVTARIDPHEVLPAYASQAGRSIAQAGLEREVLERFATIPTRPVLSGDARVAKVTGPDGKTMVLPRPIHDMVQGTFDESLSTLSKVVSQQFPRLGAGLEGMEWARNVFKRNVLLHVPGYFVLNGYNDMVQMMIGGVRNPAGRLDQAHKVLRGDAGLMIRTPSGTMSADEVLRSANENGIALGSIDRLDLTRSGARDLSKELDVAAEQAAGMRFRDLRPWTQVQRAADKADVLGRTGERVAKAWDDHSKLAMYIDRLEKGMSPEEAARQTFNFLLDYSDRGKSLQVARWFMPFATWAWKAPGMAGRAIARSPGSVSAVDRFFGAAFEGDERGYAQPWFQQERGPGHALGPGGRRALDLAMQAASLGEAGLPEGFGAVMLRRDPVSDAFQPWAQAAPWSAEAGWGLSRSNIEPLVSMLTPAARIAIEARTGQDPFSKRPLGAVLREQGGGTPLLGAAYRYGAPYVLSPVPMHLANVALHRAGGEGAPLATLGAYRPYASDPDRAFALQRMNLAFRAPFYLTSPATQVQNIRHDPRFVQALQDYETLRRNMQRVQFERNQ